MLLLKGYKPLNPIGTDAAAREELEDELNISDEDLAFLIAEIDGHETARAPGEDAGDEDDVFGKLLGVSGN